MNRSAKLFLSPLLWLTFIPLVMTCHMAIAKTRHPTLELIIGEYQIKVEIVSTPTLRMQGLMNRHNLPENHGMLFVFSETSTHCMWMHNTKIPLSAAFIDDHGIIVNIADMQPNTDDNHCSSAPVHYAIEMGSGWFQDRGIKQGMQVKGLEKAPIGR
jgi:uncharacterized membrane protein (UPF0127 family)